MLQAYAEPHSPVLDVLCGEGEGAAHRHAGPPPTVLRPGVGGAPAQAQQQARGGRAPAREQGGRRSPSDGREHQLPDPGTPGNTGQAFFHSVRLSETLPSVSKYHDVMPEIYFKILKVNIFKGNKDTKKQGKGTDTTSLAKLVTAATGHVGTILCGSVNGLVESEAQQLQL